MRGIILLMIALGGAGICQTQHFFVKIYTDQQGITAVRGDDLSAAGVIISSIDPTKLQLFSDGQNVLPEALDEPTPSLREIAIFVDDGNDGQFDASDSIRFLCRGIKPAWVG